MYFGSQHLGAYRKLSTALDIVTWSHQLRKSIPESERGITFSSPFLRGVQQMWLQIMQTVSQGPASFDDC
jgi:hypothetical protein